MLTSTQHEPSRAAHHADSRLILLVLCAAALVSGALLRALFIVRFPHVEGDSLVYGDLARNLLQHGVYGFTEATGIRPTLIRLPGYPLLLAGAFATFGVAKYKVVLWLQALLDLATCCLIGATAWRIGGRRAGMAALWLAALCPFTANYCAAPLTETPVLFTVALAMWGLLRWHEEPALRWAVVLGAALAGSVLLRPDQGLLIAAVMPAMLQSRRGTRTRAVRGVAVAALIVALPLSAWAWRNWRVFHVVQPLAPRFANDPGEPVAYGFQRWYRTWATEYASTPAVYWAYDGSPIEMDVLPARACDTAAECMRTRAVLAAYNEDASATPEVDAEFAALAAQRVKASRLRFYVEMPTLRLLDMWLRPRTVMLPLPIRWWRLQERPIAGSASLAYALLNLAYLIVAGFGLWRWKRVRWAGYGTVAAAGCAFILLRCALLLTIDNSEPRYTLECFPVLIVWAGQVWRARAWSLAATARPSAG